MSSQNSAAQALPDRSREFGLVVTFFREPDRCALWKDRRYGGLFTLGWEIGGPYLTVCEPRGGGEYSPRVGDTRVAVLQGKPWRSPTSARGESQRENGFSTRSVVG